MKRLQITIVTREQGQMVDEIINGILNDMFQHPKPLKNEQGFFGSLKDNLEFKYHQALDVHHARCHDQHVGNFCGYHATYASLCCLEILQRKQERHDVTSSASFWKFKRSIQRFLFSYKKDKKLGEVWPWRQRDMLHGDFERTYNIVCKANVKRFADCFDSPNIEYKYHTWEFQFKNIVCNEYSRKKMAKKLNYFHKFDNPNKMLLFTIMLGITNHWTCLIATKFRGKCQFWFFDSRNDDYLDYSQSDIVNYIDKLNEERVKSKKEPYNDWKMSVIHNSIIDIQISLRLLIGCMKGTQDIERYHYNRQFLIFAQDFVPITNIWQPPQFEQALIEWALSYKHDIRRFFINKVQKEELWPENRLILDKLVQALRMNFRKHRQLMYLHDLAQGRL